VAVVGGKGSDHVVERLHKVKGNITFSRNKQEFLSENIFSLNFPQVLLQV